MWKSVTKVQNYPFLVSLSVLRYIYLDCIFEQLTSFSWQASRCISSWSPRGWRSAGWRCPCRSPSTSPPPPGPRCLRWCWPSAPENQHLWDFFSVLVLEAARPPLRWELSLQRSRPCAGSWWTCPPRCRPPSSSPSLGRRWWWRMCLQWLPEIKYWWILWSFSSLRFSIIWTRMIIKIVCVAFFLTMILRI